MRMAIGLGAALLAGAACALSPAFAQDKAVQLKLSSWVPPQHPLNPSLQAWADNIKKSSGGTITSVLFPSEQLGKAFDHYDMARDGIADFAYVNPGYQPGRHLRQNRVPEHARPVRAQIARGLGKGFVPAGA